MGISSIFPPNGVADSAKDLGPKGMLICGIFFLGLAVGGILSGEALERYGRVIYRAEEPKQFWQSIAADFIFGALFIWAYAFKVRADDLIGVLIFVAFVYALYRVSVYLIYLVSRRTGR
jgi:MFS family permease